MDPLKFCVYGKLRCGTLDNVSMFLDWPFPWFHESRGIKHHYFRFFVTYWKWPFVTYLIVRGYGTLQYVRNYLHHLGIVNRHSLRVLHKTLLSFYVFDVHIRTCAYKTFVENLQINTGSTFIYLRYWVFWIRTL